MSDLFEKRVICGREIINPFRSKNSMDHLANNAEHSLKTIIDRLYWVEKERDELKEENKVLKASLRNLHNYEIVKLKNDLDSAIGRFSAIVCRKAKCDIDLEREGE